MINGVRLKVCGLTSLVDAEAADAVGADYLGFIFYPKSPRGITATQYAAMKDRLPPRKRVAVLVEPPAADLAALTHHGGVVVAPGWPGPTLARAEVATRPGREARVAAAGGDLPARHLPCRQIR